MCVTQCVCVCVCVTVCKREIVSLCVRENVDTITIAYVYIWVYDVQHLVRPFICTDHTFAFELSIFYLCWW